MVKNLLIVESPAKAKTINNYLGKDFIVKSSQGHVRDLPKDDGAIETENNFMPVYEIKKEKESIVKELRELSEKAEIVWLATDDDREGEAISWHLKEALQLPDSKIKRIVFHEITKNAILKAIDNPGKINQDLVNAQQARRILDRLVGFELSPVLWDKIKRGLSAGRVQSAAVRIIVEREREIEQFTTESTFRVSADFDMGKFGTMEAVTPKNFQTSEVALDFVKKCIGASYKIKNLEKKPAKKTPAAPFTTSTLQQEASRKLGFSVSATMSIAQKLYEAGHISYMRTDSVSLSEDALQKAAAVIKAQYGQKYLHTRQYKTKNESAQEAHEAIRPTDFSVRAPSSDARENKLYELIWKRTLASQMAEAQLERTIATVDISTVPSVPLIAEGEVIIFDGFLAVYLESNDEEEEETKNSLPPLTVGQNLIFVKMIAAEKFSRPKPRYTEASLVKALEELGIGRPSTYEPTISTIINRNYVVKESREGKQRKIIEHVLKGDKIQTLNKSETFGAEKNKLFPTDMGIIVNDFLVKYFPSVVDLSFTAKVEKEFDEIAAGKLVWNQMLRVFYDNFHPLIEKIAKSVDRKEVIQNRTLGKDPKTGRDMIVRMTKFGPVVEIVAADESQKPIYANLKKGQRLETIAYEDALELIKLPRTVGEFEGSVLSIHTGPFGIYAKHSTGNVSLPKDTDPLSISLEEVIALFVAKRESDANKTIKTFPENPNVKILNGRYGAYIAFEKKNVKIPKGKVPAEITYEECVSLAEATPEKPSRFAKKGSKTATDNTKAAKTGEESKKAAPKKAVAAKKTETKAADTKAIAKKTSRKKA